jgi:DNA invertase Pin-like site-specific DNA recombinase
MSAKRNTRHYKGVAIYIRVASEDQSRMDEQEKRLREFARENGYGNLQAYADNGYSGLNFDRPAFAKLEAGIQAGNVGAVIVRDISRISRDYLAAERWANRLANSGTALIEADEPRLLCQENFLENLREFVKRSGKGGWRP